MYNICNIYANKAIKLIDFKSGSYDWRARMVFLFYSKNWILYNIL